MATNRENINKMNNEEFAEKFNTRGQNCEVCAYWDKEHNYCHSKEFGSEVDDCKKGFIKWLSQEAEEDTQEEIHLTMPEDENTRKVIEYIIPRLTLLSARLDKLERNYIPTEEDQLKILDEITAEPKQEKTADKMFEELGYKRIEANHGCYIAYEHKEERGGMTASERIIIDTSHNLYRYAKMDKEERSCAITEAEDKAIHKKIEEMKNE